MSDNESLEPFFNDKASEANGVKRDIRTVVKNPIDASTEALTVIQYEHHEVHAGSHYVYTDGITLGNTDAQQWMITTPAGPGECHMVFSFFSGLGSIWTLHEAGDRVGDALQTVANSNRNSTNSSGCIVHKGVTGAGSTDGNLIATLAVGSASVGGKSGGGTRSAEELILKFSTKYIMTVTSQAVANNITIFMTWYDHTPKG